MLQIKNITSESEFKQLEREWEDLLAKSQSDTIFLSWDWLYGWWQIFKENKRLNLITISERGKLIGIAPLCVFERKYLGLLKVETIGFLGAEGVGSDHLDFIIEKGREKEVSEAVLNHLSSNGSGWHTIDMNSIPEDSLNLRHIRALADKMGFKTSFIERLPCPYIKLPPDWNTYVKSLSKSMQYDIKRKTSRIEKNFDIDFCLVTDERELENATGKLIHLNQLRMKAKNIDGAFCQKMFADFHRLIIPVLFRKDKLRLYFIKEKGTEIAALYNFKHNDKYLFYQSGYDSKMEKWSLGTVLFRYTIEKAIEEGIKEFDLLRGDERYKYRWTSEARNNIVLYIYNRGLKSRFAYLTDKGKASIKHILKKSKWARRNGPSTGLEPQGFRTLKK